MFIKELYLKAFGKFHDKQITLTNGLNLIYGGNESGKTTIHKFIEGMFFGFFKPYSKNKLYTADHARFTPWSGRDFKGIIEYSVENKEFRLERSFHKNNESVKLFDGRSGSDLTDSLDYDPSYKLPKANKHIPINNVLFNNTVSIGQLSNITDQGLVREIGDLFVDTSGTHSSGVSLKSAIENLENLKSRIGTQNQSKSPYGKTVIRLRELEEEKAKSEEVAAVNKQRYAEIRRFEDALEKIQTEKGDINSHRENLRLGLMRGKYERFTELKEETEDLQKRVVEDRRIDDVTAQHYDITIGKIEVCESQLESIRGQRTEMTDGIARAQAALDSINQSINNAPVGDMMNDKVILENSMSKLDKLMNDKNVKEDPAIKTRYNAVLKQQRLLSTISISLFILGIVCGILYFPTTQNLFLILAASITALGIGAFVFYLKNKSKCLQFEERYEKYDTIMSRTTNMILMCEMDIEQFIMKYNCEDINELSQMLAETHSTVVKINELEKQIAHLTTTLNNLKDRHIALNEERLELNGQLRAYMEKAGVDSTEEFRLAILSMREQAVIKTKIEANLEAMKNVIGDLDFSQIEREAKTAAEKNVPANMKEISSIEDEVEKTNNELLKLTTETAALKATVSESESSARQLNEVVEEIIYCKAKISEYETSIKAYSLAIDKIQELSKDIQNTFAEAFNDYVSAMISEITKGKYTRVFVNDQIEIKVEDKELGQFVDVSSLSGGTIDQLYFCVRFAIMDLIIQDKKIPVILDDCMLQYDDSRLNNIISLICEKAKERQIIMFSCRQAEKQALEEKDYEYNFIDLTRQPAPAE